MDEQKVPVLTLNTQSGAQQALEQAVAQLEAPEAPNADNAVAAALDDNFSAEERAEIERFAGTIDVTNPDHVMLYGADAQKKVSEFADSILNTVKNTDSGEVGDILTNLITELKSFEGSTQKPKGLRGLFFNAKAQLAAVQARYDAVSQNVETISASLEQHQIQLLKDAAMLDQMYQLNLTYYKELSMYILAGKEKIQQVKEQELPELIKRAEESGLPEDTQKAKDLAELCNRFEKKIYDLELTRTISMQMAPQIRLVQSNEMLMIEKIQSNDTAMSEKIQSTLVNTIPLWKSQMVLAIGVEHSAQAAKAQREVTDMTNTLLKKNAETLKLATVETAKESERGIVDIETLKQTNETLISTLDEVLQIQEDGRNKRREAEAELTQIETTMRNKLMEMSRTK